MLAAERRQYILNELYKNKAVASNELAEELGVTTMTIRRDLHLLESQGLLEKSHGGAVLAESLVKEATYRNRKLAHVEEKQHIAKTALSFIESSMSVYIDAGTTTYELAELMAQQHWEDLTVVTNDLSISQILSPVRGIDTIMVGGHVDRESNSTCGVLAVNMVQCMHFDLCLLGTQAITKDWRIMTANADKVDVKRACIHAADQVVLLADHSKFHKHKLYYIAGLDEINVLVSDYKTKEDEFRKLQELGVDYVLV